MSTLITVYSDLHKGSKYLDKNVKVPTTVDEVLKENAIDLGDSHEIKNCEPKDLMRLRNDLAIYNAIFKGRKVTGNHELDHSQDPHYVIITISGKKICLVHGDYLLKGDKWANDFRAEKAGQGSGLSQKFLASWNGSFSKKEATTLANYALGMGCNIIFCGHVHPKSITEYNINGVRVVCFPRGKSTIVI